MEYLGKLVEWDDTRGFGFISPIDRSGERIFLHIHDYRLMGRRPEIGEVLRYVPQRQPDGRWRAINVARAVSSAHKQLRADADHERHLRSPTTWLPPLLVPSFIALLAWAAWSHALSTIMLVVLAAVNIVTFLAYWRDKRAAALDMRRTPESTLHTLEVLGGWPAAWLAQITLRHKSRKPSFRFAFLMLSFVNFALGAVWLLLGKAG